MSGLRSNWHIWLRSLTILVFVLTAAASSHAQSGRSIPKRSAATPTATPALEIPKSVEPPPKLYTLKVVAEMSQAVYFAFPFPERSKSWAIERLRKSPLLDVRDSGQANRREAIRRAETETEAFVVLLQIDADPIYLSPGSRAAAGEIFLDFWVYAPITGKVKQTGRVRLSQTSRDGINAPLIRTCRPDLGSDEFLLLKASFEVADRILNSWNLPIPTDCR